MTKEESRTLLQKIEKLLGQAEPDGYIDLAFKGCVGLAYNNIDNDWACSPMDWRDGCYNKDRELEELRSVKDAWHEKFQMEQGLLKTANETVDKWVEDYHKLEVKSDNQEQEIIILKDQIVQLKAKLYDMMVERGS